MSGVEGYALDTNEARMVTLFLAFVRGLDPAQRQALAAFMDSMAHGLNPLDAADWFVMTGETPKRPAR
jgi:hypothetical protein